MLAGFAITACARGAERSTEFEFQWLAPKALVRKAGAIVPIYDAENPPLLAVTSSVGLSGHWEGGAPLEIVRAERRGARLLIWAALPPGRPTWLEISGKRSAVEVWPVLSTLPEIAALPQPAAARREQIGVLIADPKKDLLVSLAARMELARSYQRENDGPRARSAWLELSDAANAAQIPSLVTHGIRSAAYVDYFVERDFAGALSLLEQAEVIDQESGFEAGAVRTALLRGLVAEEYGQLRDAARSFSEGARIARALGLDRDAAFHLKGLAPLLQAEGLHDEALRVMEEVESSFLGSKDQRDRVWYLNDLCWILVRGMAAGTIRPGPERIRRLAAEAIVSAEAIGAREELAAIHASLAWLEVLLDRRTEARAEIARAKASQGASPGFASLFIVLLEARIDLDEGQFPEAYRKASELEARARAESTGLATDLVWRALELRALAADRLGRSIEAGELYDRALFALESVSTRVGLLEARGPYFADRRSLLDNSIAHWLGLHAADKAFEITDRYIGSSYRVLDRAAKRERLDGETAAKIVGLGRELDQLRARQATAEADLEVVPPAKRRALESQIRELKGDVLRIGSALEPLLDTETSAAPSLVSVLGSEEAIVLFVSGDPEPRGFLVTRRGARLAVEVVGGPAAPLELDARIRHLYVVAGDVAGASKLGAQLGKDGAPLIAQVSISYLPSASALANERTNGTLVGPPLIVADPGGDLPEARSEGRKLAARFAGATLLEGDAAKKSRLLAELEGRSLFHFAGHGSLGGPWRAHLRLAGDRLEAIDVLVARPRVGLVVLNGCETGVAETLGPTQAIALPELWWVAGARAVLSTNRTIGDAEARRFIEAFYDNGGAERPIEAYRQAALTMITKNDDAWQAFRVVGLR